jgi:hypothetical protein
MGAQSRGSRASSRRKFTPEEDALLRSIVDELGTESWGEISHRMPGRTARQCRDRYNNYLLDTLVANPWSPEEDAIVCRQYRELGPHWVQIAMLLNGRSGNHVKNRWHKHLSRMDPLSLASLPRTPPEGDKPMINLCEAIGVNDCDVLSLFTQLSGQMAVRWVASGSFSPGEGLM